MVRILTTMMIKIRKDKYEKNLHFIVWTLVTFFLQLR
jgi:hypothetical protein